ncbi:hypothetical protein [Modestobacter sp. NPDC049651]|uniref:hypothetical protein n=1 Tax=unclassified Modestobacter TaxID=2643866 RepID=UPI0033CF1865
MTDPDQSALDSTTLDRAARDSALNDAEFPDDERGLTGTEEDVARDTVSEPEGQTARDVVPEDDGVPEVAEDDSPTMQRAEDPEFAPLPGDREHSTVDFGTTAREQSEGESLSQRLAEEVPDPALSEDGGTGEGVVRAAESHDRTVPQLDQDGVSDRADSFTDSVSDDVVATGEANVGGEGPEETAMHVTDG